MSRYLLDKFLYDVDRDPELTEAYRADPAALVERWERERMRVLTGVPGDDTTWTRLTDEERGALVAHDYVAIQELGGHPFLTLTLFIALFERDHAEPLGFQREYARRLAHWSLPYPDIAT
ncbi:hypothetical protein GCM10018793_38100 [Streptomyces sulfonofaciens]|uniref:Extradiol ring-cleavage dioxygenase LigAB LigA subunit domain-containing protein n=1 Tax=Streptomyces sulfonofaciens TaxID=68272 RepID=A0A919GC13_9ACTN|nr:hypothetical protein [Streptomyces sulfonofaciens]GHH81241.1 hypothetical protein GCM10018793_38100 [Streptomyces sulfonofaciens]